MRLSEIGDKEILEITKGTMYGKLWDAELIFDHRNGNIHSLLIPGFGGNGGFKSELKLPWSSIIVIGEDAIVFKM